MTIRFLADYGQYKANDTVTLSTNEESTLVSQNFATTNLTGGTAYNPALPDVPSYGLHIKTVSAAKFAQVQAAGVPSNINISYRVTDTGVIWKWNVLSGAFVAEGAGGGSSETYTPISTTTVSTSATPTGGAAVAPASLACTGLLVKNVPVAIEYQRNGTGAFYKIRPNETKLILGITDASQIGFRRTDYATARTTQVSAIPLIAINTSATYSVSIINCTTTTNTTYTAFASLACLSLEVKNTTAKDVNIKLNAGAVATRLRVNEAILISGITNANQVSVVSFDTNSALTVVAEAYQSVPSIKTFVFEPASLILDTAKIQLGEASLPTHGNNVDNTQVFAMPSFFGAFNRYRPKKKSITQFSTVANSIITGGTTANTSLSTVSPAEAFPTWSQSAQFGSITAVTNTFTGSTTNSYLSNINTISPINVTGTDIHVTLQRVGVAGTVSGVFVDLFSAGTPASPDANYHTLNINADLSNGLTPAYGYGARSFGIENFTAVGTGATLTAITYARLRVTGTSGLVIRPSDVSSCKRNKTKATVIFCFDDSHSVAVTTALPILASYGFPAVIYPSQNALVTGGNGQPEGNISVDNILNLQNRFGWQIASQDWYKEQTIDMQPSEWAVEQNKNLIMGAALGLDMDGLRDGSYYGGGPYYITSEQYKKSPVIHASLRQFYSPNNGDASVVQTPFSFCDTNPPGDPWLIRALNMIGYTSGFTASDGTGTITARMISYIDQARAINGVSVFVMHRDLVTNPEALVVFKAICAYINTNSATVEVDTFAGLRRSQV